MRANIKSTKQYPINWTKMARLIQWLTVHNGFGTNKSTSGNFQLFFDNCDMFSDDEINPGIHIEIQGYDLGPLSRHETAGPFCSEEDAFDYCVGLLEWAVEKMKNLEDSEVQSVSREKLLALKNFDSFLGG